METKAEQSISKISAPSLRRLERPDHPVHRDAMKIAQERVRNSRLEAFGPLMEAVGKFRDEMDKPKN